MAVTFTAVIMKIMFCGVCSLIEIYQRFGKTCFFRIKAQRTEFYDSLKVFQPPFPICSMTAHYILLRFMALQLSTHNNVTPLLHPHVV
jgi:hypothetical protein